MSSGGPAATLSAVWQSNLEISRLCTPNTIAEEIEGDSVLQSSNSEQSGNTQACQGDVQPCLPPSLILENLVCLCLCVCMCVLLFDCVRARLLILLHSPGLTGISTPECCVCLLVCYTVML